MANRTPTPSNPDRRKFLKGAAATTAAFAAPAAQAAPSPSPQAQRPANATATPPTDAQLARETGPAKPAPASRVIEHPGSDFMVDVLKTLDLEYLGANPGSTFDSLHESIINYGNNQNPEFLTCLHEESAVAMAHGYAKASGKPMMALIHGTVGLLHSSMAIYNAYADRVPIYIVVGNHADSTERNGPEAYHSAQDMGSLVRSFCKWDDQPYSLQAFAESAVWAYKIAMTPPMGPVLIVADYEIQSPAYNPAGLRIPKLVLTAPPAGDQAAVKQTAEWLVAAERPLIVAQRGARTPAGMQLITELAELLQAPVNNQDRMNIASRHPLAGNGGRGYTADVTLCLELSDPSGTARAARARGGKCVNISSISLNHGSNQADYGHYTEADLDIAADAEATLPYLIEECRKLITPDRRRTLDARGATIAQAHRTARVQAVAQAQYGWNASPISLGRLCSEVWAQIKDEDWALVSWQGFISNWPNRLWDFKHHYQYLGASGAAGIGYTAPATVGAALANRKEGRLSISIQGDGDLNYAPGVLWTAAHHKIPLLTIMHNNRGYHAEVMLVAEQCSLHNRGQDRVHIGTKLTDPNINYAKMAEGYGIYSQGPIADPGDLAGAIRRGIERVKAGEPALIDVLTQPR